MEESLADGFSSPLLLQGMFERIGTASFKWYPDSKGRNTIQSRSGERYRESSILVNWLGIPLTSMLKSCIDMAYEDKASD